MDALGALQAALPTLVVPESAVVVTALLGERGQARGVFCYVDKRLGPDAPPFAFVPAAEEVRRVPGALGWVSISYEPLLVRALGAGPLLTLTLTLTLALALPLTLTLTLTLALALVLNLTLTLTLALTLTLPWFIIIIIIIIIIFPICS